MKTVRGTHSEIMSHDVWHNSSEDVFAVWSESDLHQNRACTCGAQSHMDIGWDMGDYTANAFGMLEMTGVTGGMKVTAVHVPPHRVEAFRTWARQEDPRSNGDTLWGAEIKVNADLGANVLRVRTKDAVGVPLREIEFSVPWE